MKIHPLRKGYSTPATAEVLQAVRNVIADWDGSNWLAVRHCIETTMPSAAGLDDWTLDDVRQRFAIGQRKMTIEIGGRVNTTDATILPIRSATIGVEPIELLSKLWGEPEQLQADKVPANDVHDRAIAARNSDKTWPEVFKIIKDRKPKTGECDAFRQRVVAYDKQTKNSLIKESPGRKRTQKSD